MKAKVFGTQTINETTRETRTGKLVAIIPSSAVIHSSSYNSGKHANKTKVVSDMAIIVSTKSDSC